MTTRKALLVGINAYPDAPLRGCINDVKQMQAALKRYYSFADANIRLVLDKDATLAGMKAGLEWLAQGGNDADAVRVFHFSGHGVQVVDKNGDEPDGRDEALAPYDYKTAGMLIDDDLGALYDRFPKIGNLTLIMDSCHSGTVQRDLTNDVVYRFIPVSRAEERKMEAAKSRFEDEAQDYAVKQLRAMDISKLSDAELKAKVGRLISSFQKKRFGDVRSREANVLVSGCRPDQQSADARIGGDFHGALTYHLVETIDEANGNLSYRALVETTGDKLAKGNYVQAPQLEYRAGRDRRQAFKPFA